MRADLTACGAQGIDAWLLGLLLGLAVSLVPFLFSMRRRRAGLGCAFSALLLAATPALWLVEPISGLVPLRWLECGTTTRAVTLSGITPATVLVIAIVLSALVWASSVGGRRRTRKSPPTEGGLSS